MCSACVDIVASLLTLAGWYGTLLVPGPVPVPVPVPVSQQGVIIRSRTCYTVTRGCIVNFMAAAADAGESNSERAGRSPTNNVILITNRDHGQPARQIQSSREMGT